MPSETWTEVKVKQKVLKNIIITYFINYLAYQLDSGKDKKSTIHYEKVSLITVVIVIQKTFDPFMHKIFYT